MVFVPLAGLIAGFIDSIAGGGGLITLPMLSFVVGPGAHAIGTNKIVGASGALIALLVYMRKGHLDWAKGILFVMTAATGAYVGSQVSPHIPVQAFPWLMAITCPLILAVVWRKDAWVAAELQHPPSHRTHALVLIAGLCVGFYDGAWGPGGGTFMLLALLWVSKLPLLTALAISKLANTSTASASLIGYARQNYVHWQEGALMSVGMCVGAFFGASLATRKAAQIVRPVLAVVAVLLLVKVILAAR
jgi:uncharacterized membrane protein YfcA